MVVDDRFLARRQQAKQAEAPEQQQAEMKAVDAPTDTGAADTTAEDQAQQAEVDVKALNGAADANSADTNTDTGATGTATEDLVKAKAEHKQPETEMQQISEQNSDAGEAMSVKEMIANRLLNEHSGELQRFMLEHDMGIGSLDDNLLPPELGLKTEGSPEDRLPSYADAWVHGATPGSEMRLINSQPLPGDLQHVLNLDAVQQSGMVLQHVPNEMRSEELCMAAVQQDGRAVIDVPDNMLSEDLCMAAVQQNGMVIEYLSDEMRSDIVASMNAKNSNQSEQAQATEQAQAEPEQQQVQAGAKASDANADTSNASQGTAEQQETKVKQDAPVQVEAQQAQVAEPARQEPEAQQQVEPAKQEPEQGKDEVKAAESVSEEVSQSEVEMKQAEPVQAEVQQPEVAEPVKQEQTEVKAVDANAETGSNQASDEPKETQVQQDAPVQAEAPQAAQERGYDPYQRVRDMESKGQTQIDQEKSKGTYEANNQADMGSLSEQGDKAKQASSEVSKGPQEEKEKAMAM